MQRANCVHVPPVLFHVPVRCSTLHRSPTRALRHAFFLIPPEISERELCDQTQAPPPEAAGHRVNRVFAVSGTRGSSSRGTMSVPERVSIRRDTLRRSSRTSARAAIARGTELPPPPRFTFAAIDRSRRAAPRRLNSRSPLDISRNGTNGARLSTRPTWPGRDYGAEGTGAIEARPFRRKREPATRSAVINCPRIADNRPLDRPDRIGQCARHARLAAAIPDARNYLADGQVCPIVFANSSPSGAEIASCPFAPSDIWLSSAAIDLRAPLPRGWTFILGAGRFPRKYAARKGRFSKH